MELTQVKKTILIPSLCACLQGKSQANSSYSWFVNTQDELIKHWKSVLERIRSAELAHSRKPGSVKLLAVSKTFPLHDIATLAQAGQIDFGENYISEGVQKIEVARTQSALSGLVWHCIGPIQSNKTKWVASHFAWAHAIDRLKIAERLSEQRPHHLPPLNVLIQVNVDGGLTKSGVPPEDALALAQGLLGLKGLKLRGLMTLPDPSPTREQQVAVHQRGFEVFHDLKARLGLGPDEAMDTLSMGMTQDMEAAIQAGSTCVRVGTAIFGARAPKAQVMDGATVGTENP